MGWGLFEMSRWIIESLCLLNLLIEGRTHLIDVDVSEVFEDSIDVVGREERSSIIIGTRFSLDTVPCLVVVGVVDTVVTA